VNANNLALGNSGFSQSHQELTQKKSSFDDHSKVQSKMRSGVVK